MEALLKSWRSFAESLGIKRWMLFALFLGVLLPLAIFGAIADRIREGYVFAPDAFILNGLHRHASPTRDTIMELITDSGRPWALVPVCVVVVLLLLWKKLPRQAFFFTLSSAGSGLLNLLAKLFFGRDRPDLWLSVAPESNYSFPSGHAMATMAVAAALVLILWPTRFRWPVTVLGVLWVAAVGVSRLYLGVHYPSDILGGWCASLAWVGGVYAIINARRQWITRAERLKTALSSTNNSAPSL